MDLGTISTAVMVRQRSTDSIMTGTHFGLYAFGANHEPGFSPATFGYASWTGDRVRSKTGITYKDTLLTFAFHLTGV